MEISIDPEVKSVAEFMQRNVAATRLVAVAKAIGDIPPLLWSHHGLEPRQVLRPLLLSELPILACDQRRLSSASERGLAR